MEAEKHTGDDEEGSAECWLHSPTLDEFKQTIQESLLLLADSNSDPDSKPRLRVYKYPEFLINIAVRHILNNNFTDFIVEFQTHYPEDFETIKKVAAEIDEQISSALLGLSYVCTTVEIFGSDLVAVKVKL